MEPDNAILVYGSNTMGRHGLGVAQLAHKEFGAKYGIGEGLVGKSYGIPTKDGRYKSLRVPEARLNLDQIRSGVERWKICAKNNPELNFYVTRVGCGAAMNTDADIAPMFIGAGHNCNFDPAWKPWTLQPWNYCVLQTRDLRTGHYERCLTNVDPINMCTCARIAMLA